MSSMTSIFNSSSTIVTMDLYRRCRPKASEMELMIFGRMWTVILAGIAVAWLPILFSVQGSTFWDYSQSISSFLVPPTVTVFYFGIFWKRATEPVRIKFRFRCSLLNTYEVVESLKIIKLQFWTLLENYFPRVYLFTFVNSFIH